MTQKTLVSAKDAAARERKAPAVRVVRPPVVIPKPPRAAYQIEDPAERRAYTMLAPYTHAGYRPTTTALPRASITEFDLSSAKKKWRHLEYQKNP